jgi:hypothetical protein
MADLLDTVRSEIDARLDELRPLVEEAAGLEAALAALERSDGAATPARVRRRSSRATPAGRRSASIATRSPRASRSSRSQGSL